MTGMIIGHVVITLPFVFMNVAAAMESFDPAYDLAARSLDTGSGIRRGAGHDAHSRYRSDR